MKRYCFDIDGTICTKGVEYQNAIPFKNVVDTINRLYDDGNYIEIQTARGSRSKKDWFDLTKTQLEFWGVKYHSLSVGEKSYADVFVDDRSTKKISNVLAIGAHPDDIEFGCGGTLVKHKNNGDFVVYLCMTNTESKDGVTGETIRSLDQNKEEVIAAANKLGCDIVEFLPFKDLHVPFSFDSISKMESIIRKYNIDTIYTHWAGDANQDHISTFKTTMAASRYVHNVFCYEQIPIARMTENQMDINYYVDITDTFNKKIEASLCHESQIIKYKKVNFDVKENLEILSKFRGIQARCKYAEAFKIIKMVNI
jgi:LmbE family N-acetylglucosaminyl deacetylase